MARDLNKRADGDVSAANRHTAPTDVRTSSRQVSDGLLRKLATDAYCLGLSLLMLTAAYWALLRDTPFGMVGFGLVLSVMLGLDLLLMLR